VKPSVGNPASASVLAQALGSALSAESLARFDHYAAELRRFGARLNLTAIRDAAEVVDKHFADSLCISRAVPAGSLLDVGAGAGFPGLPLAIVRSDLRVTLVDASKKKVGFMKSLLASLNLSNATAIHAHLDAGPAFGLFDSVVSRAFTDVPAWLDLARHHVAPGGRVLAMSGRSLERSSLEAMAARASLRLVDAVSYALPASGDPRFLAVFVKDPDRPAA
jgi:16S rRNA (guanine527-N7)-methyltransferase